MKRWRGGQGSEAPPALGHRRQAQQVGREGSRSPATSRGSARGARRPAAVPTRGPAAGARRRVPAPRSGKPTAGPWSALRATTVSAALKAKKASRRPTAWHAPASTGDLRRSPPSSRKSKPSAASSRWPRNPLTRKTPEARARTQLSSVGAEQHQRAGQRRCRPHRSRQPRQQGLSLALGASSASPRPLVLAALQVSRRRQGRQGIDPVRESAAGERALPRSPKIRRRARSGGQRRSHDVTTKTQPTGHSLLWNTQSQVD